MKILMITRGYPHEKDPQEGCFEMDQAQALAAMGHEVFTMSVESRFRPYWRNLGISRVNNGKVVSYKIFYFPSAIVRHLINQKIGHYIEALQALKLYKHIISREGRFDIIHCHYLYNIYYGVFIASQIKIPPLIGTEHWSVMAKTVIPSWVKSFCMSCYGELDKLITVSKYLQDIILREFDISSTVCGNVLSPTFVTPPIRSVRNASEYTFVTCGSLIYRKGIDLIIEAAADFNTTERNWKVIIIGDGPKRQQLMTMVAKRNLSENIVFKGKLSKKDIIKIYDQADAFILASRSETFGVVVIEAMSRGLPIITTRCGGTEGLVNKESGIMIPINDTQALSKAMSDFYLNSREKFCTRIIRERCLETYGPNAIAHNLTQIYTETIKKVKDETTYNNWSGRYGENHV